MSEGSNAAAIGNLEKKMDNLTKEIEGIKKSLDTLSNIPEIHERVEKLEEGMKSLHDELSPVSQIGELMKSVKGIDSSVEKFTTKDMDAFGKKIDDMMNQVKGIDSGISDVKESVDTKEISKKVDDLLSEVEGLSKAKEMEDLGKQIDNILDSVKAVQESDSSDTMKKKLDEMDDKVTSLVTLEDSVKEMSDSFTETKEIVGIIVRQLDDIERKYNKTIEDVKQALDMMQKVIEKGLAPAKEPDDKKKKRPEKAEEDAEEIISTDPALPSTVDDLMDHLLSLVKPQTDARAMAQALEEVRDKLTTMIQGHTPVLFQFGKRARELKSYPPTATLNENDIARLNKEIRDWRQKLKKIASES